MYRYIFGIDKNDPVGCARMLKSKGISAVVTDASGAHLAPILKQEGLDTYLCFGAYGMGGAKNSRQCVDASGDRRVWFSSGCPNDRLLADTNLNRILETGHDSISGIFVDGARFASFASAEGPDAFFTCFCPECMDRMSALGMDAERVREAVIRLSGDRCLEGDDHLIADWLRMREDSVKAYMDRFAALLHAVSPSMKAGAFVFEPMLAPLVGQTSRACASLDIIAPMLYRNYPHDTGPACMGHEWAAMLNLLGNSASRLLRAAGIAGSLPYNTTDAASIRQTGFSISDVGRRVALSASSLLPGQSLWPIIQIEDDQLRKTESACLRNGAESVGYFMYGQAELPDMTGN